MGAALSEEDAPKHKQPLAASKGLLSRENLRREDDAARTRRREPCRHVKAIDGGSAPRA